MPSLMVVPLAVSEELKQTDRIGLYIFESSISQQIFPWLPKPSKQIKICLPSCNTTAFLFQNGLQKEETQNFRFSRLEHFQPYLQSFSEKKVQCVCVERND